MCNSGVCIIILYHVGTVIHYALPLRLAYVQLKHQGIQVTHIVPYLGGFTRKTKYHYK